MILLLVACAQPDPSVWTVDTVERLRPRVADRVERLPASSVGGNALATLQRTAVAASRARPDAPWMVAHLLLADPTAPLAGLGAAMVPVEEGGRTWSVFPRTPDADAHSALLLKSLMESGAPMDTALGTSTLADLYRYTLLHAELDPEHRTSSFSSPDDMPWAVHALALGAPGRPLRWVSFGGASMDLDTLTHFLVTVLARESAFLYAARQAGTTFQREGQGLFSFTCGGAHLLQGAAGAVAAGFGTPEDEAEVRRQAELLAWRVPIELAITQRTIEEHPDLELRLRLQQLKLLGHALESLGKLRAYGLYAGGDAGAAGALDDVVARLDALGAWTGVESRRAAEPQVYHDLLGDGDHAVRGLRIWRGEDGVRR